MKSLSGKPNFEVFKQSEFHEIQQNIYYSYPGSERRSSIITMHNSGLSLDNWPLKKVLNVRKGRSAVYQLFKKSPDMNFFDILFLFLF